MLSDRERKVLHDLELQIVAEDPALARALGRGARPVSPRLHLRILLAIACCWLVVCLMVAAGLAQLAMMLVAMGALLACLWQLRHLDGPRSGKRG